MSPETQATQIGTQISIETIAELLTKQSNMLSEFMDSMKGSYNTTVRETAIKQDIGTDEVMSVQAAALNNNNQFWANQIMFQTTLLNAENLRAFSNNNVITNQQNWNGTAVARTTEEKAAAKL